MPRIFSGERNFDSSSTSPISNNPFIQNTDKIDARDLKINEVESRTMPLPKIKQMLMADAVPQNSSGISADDVGVQLRVNSDVMFKPGSIELLPEGTKVLEAVLKLMNEYNLYLVVRGHADSSEAQTALCLGMGAFWRALLGHGALSCQPRHQAHAHAGRKLRRHAPPQARH